MSEKIPTYPPLYIINHNNKLYEWTIRIEKIGSIYRIITENGEKDGKKVPHSRDIEEGKAKRSVLEQEILEANRKFENKKEKELYVEKIDTSASAKIVVRPMLANTFSFEDYEKKGSRAFKISFPAYVQRKYDGIRCISYIKNNEVILESRKGIPFENFELLKEQLTYLFKKLPKNFYFDGELYTDKLDFEVVSGLIRLSKKKANASDLEAINKIEYHIYDFVDLDQLTMKYEDRYNFLFKFTKDNFNKNTNLCVPVETITVKKLEDVKTYHNKFVQEGYEGLMVRDPNGPYEVNKRSKYLQKYKEFMEEEFKIVGFHDGSGDEKEAVIWDCITKDNKTFAVRPKGTFETRKKLYKEANKYIGKLLTVIFQEYSSDNVPRFPVGKAIRDIY